MNIPRWLVLGVAALVIAFGAYRLYLALGKSGDSDEKQQRRGFYGMSKRTHLMIGILYLVMGAGLVATGFGWNPFGASIGPDTEEPAASEAPSKPGSIPIDQLPTKKN